MWKLYLLLKDGLKDREREKVFFDEIEKLLLASPSGTLFECLPVLYDNKDIEKVPKDKGLIILFMNGLATNSFYEFVDLIEEFIR